MSASLSTVDQPNPRSDQPQTQPAFQPFDPKAERGAYARHLPHWRQPGASYFITFRLGDSLPHAKLRQWRRERCQWLQAHRIKHASDVRQLPERERMEFHRRFTMRMDTWLDEGMGECILAQPRIAEIAADSLRRFDQDRYILDEFVVMPNHIHLLCLPLEGNELEKVLCSWKGFTARRMNQELGRKGRLWQEESFDHIVRDADHLQRFRHYIRANPARAGLSPDKFLLGRGSGIAT